MYKNVKRSILKKYINIECKNINISGHVSSFYIGKSIITNIKNKAIEEAFNVSKMSYIMYSQYKKNTIGKEDINKIEYFLLEESFKRIYKDLNAMNGVEVSDEILKFHNETYTIKYFEEFIKNKIIEYYIRPIIDGDKIFRICYYTKNGDFLIDFNMIDNFKLSRMGMEKNIMNNQYVTIKEINSLLSTDSSMLWFKYRKKYVFYYFDKWYSKLNR